MITLPRIAVGECNIHRRVRRRRDQIEIHARPQPGPLDMERRRHPRSTGSPLGSHPSPRIFHIKAVTIRTHDAGVVHIPRPAARPPNRRVAGWILPRPFHRPRQLPPVAGEAFEIESGPDQTPAGGVVTAALPVDRPAAGTARACAWQERFGRVARRSASVLAHADQPVRGIGRLIAPEAQPAYASCCGDGCRRVGNTVLAGQI